MGAKYASDFLVITYIKPPYVTLCMSSLIDQSRLIFWKRMHMSHNINLCILSRFVLNRFSATGSVYGINGTAVSFSAIKKSIWATFAGHALQSL